MVRGQAPPLLPDRLVAARRAAGLTQQSLAEALGVSHRTIVQYEKGRERPEIQRLAALAQALGARMADLVVPGSLPAGLAGLRLGAGLTLAAAADAVRAQLPAGGGIACSRPVLADAEKGVLPPTWAPPPAAGAVRNALGVAYGAEVDAVVDAWRATFAPDDQAEQEAGFRNPTSNEAVSETTPPNPWSTDADRTSDLPGAHQGREPEAGAPADTPAPDDVRITRLTAAEAATVWPGGDRVYAVRVGDRLLGWVWRTAEGKEWGTGLANETGALAEILTLMERSGRRTRAQAVGLLRERADHTGPHPRWTPMPDRADTPQEDPDPEAVVDMAERIGPEWAQPNPAWARRRPRTL